MVVKIVRIFSTPICPYCHIAKEFFKRNNIKFVEIDVSKNRGAAEEMIRLSGQRSVPVIDIDGKIIVGFVESAIRKALRLNA